MHFLATLGTKFECLFCIHRKPILETVASPDGIGAQSKLEFIFACNLKFQYPRYAVCRRRCITIELKKKLHNKE